MTTLASHPNDDICVFADGPEACEADIRGCFPCKLRLWSYQHMQLSPAATPTKTRSFGPLGSKNRNSWERGIVTSSRADGTEMPLLRADGELVRQKEYP